MNSSSAQSHVFKKFEEGSLLQVVCSDIVERFQVNDSFPHFIPILVLSTPSQPNTSLVSTQPSPLQILIRVTKKCGL